MMWIIDVAKQYSQNRERTVRAEMIRSRDCIKARFAKWSTKNNLAKGMTVHKRQ